MCSNESYGSTREKICRVFVVSDEDNNELRRFQINIAQFLQSSYVNLSSIFQLMQNKGLTLNGHQFYLPLLNIIYNPEGPDVFVPLSQLSERVINILIQSPLFSFCSEAEPEGQIQVQQAKRQKQPERVIRSVLEHVKLWRAMHTRNKKLSLTDAAKMLGISKKTLDDYFLQLRLGELYGFDFQSNLDQKVGVLRAHIRKNEVKELETRLPKEIKSFDYVKDLEELEEELLQEREDKIQPSNTSNTADPQENSDNGLLELRGLI